MKPVNFKGNNTLIRKPESMSESECSNLPAWVGRSCIMEISQLNSTYGILQVMECEVSKFEDNIKPASYKYTKERERKRAFTIKEGKKYVLKIGFEYVKTCHIDYILPYKNGKGKVVVFRYWSRRKQGFVLETMHSEELTYYNKLLKI